MKISLRNYILWLSISLVFSVVSFFAGYYKAQENFVCDPFRIIKQEHSQQPPSIDALLKGGKE